MGTTKKIIAVLCLLAFSATAQKDDYIRPGLLKSSLTITPSWMLNKSDLNYNLTGFLEGYLDKHLSLRMESHYFMDGRNDDPFYKFNSQNYFGVLTHINKNNFDAHLGFMPGFSVNQVSGDLKTNGKHQIHFTPTFAINIGCTYYIWKVFNVFANATYVHSSISELNRAGGIDGRADEFMISAGLGFNVNTIRKK